jgi:protein-S-isoprenylcysteine O-methyltransferase Ste14
MTSESPITRDNAIRTKTSLGTSIFVLFRLLDPPLIWAILARGIASNLINFLKHNSFSFDKHDSSFGPFSPQAAILFMTIASSLKHVFWILFVSERQMSVVSGLLFGGLEMDFDVLSSILFLLIDSSLTSIKSWVFFFGIFLFVFGFLLETVSEIQRRNFKCKPIGREKPYSHGLFAWARNINYGGHILWRSGFAMVSAGWIWAVIVGGLYFYYFAMSKVPVKDRHCQEKVGLRSLNPVQNHSICLHLV